MNWRIGSIGKVPLYLDRSWPIGVLILTYIYFSSLTAGGLETGRALAYAVAMAALLFASVLVHEVSHGVAGRALGSPPSSYTLTIFGGYTSFKKTDRGPLTAAAISLAGPVSNLVLAGIFYLVASNMPADLAYLRPLAEITAWMNLILGIFNLAPGLPMDGGHVVAAIAWKITGVKERGQIIAGWAGRLIAIGLVAWVAVPWIMDAASGTQRANYVNIWPAIIALFLWTGASQAIRVGKARLSVRDLDLRTLMVRVPALPPTARAADVSNVGAVVVEGGEVRAVVLRKELPPVIDDGVPVSSLARTVSPTQVISTAIGADAVGEVAKAAAEGDLVVLWDGHEAWIARIDDIAARLPR